MSVTFKTTFGDLKFELHIAETPQTCKNFLVLCASNHYKNTKFHRLIRGFLLQGGITKNNIIDSILNGHYIKKEIVEGLQFSNRGILGMVAATSSDESDEADKKDCNHESQFFITLGPANNLNGVNTVFGNLIWGFDTLNAIEATPVDGETPKVDIIIEDVVIHANPIADAA